MAFSFNPTVQSGGEGQGMAPAPASSLTPSSIPDVPLSDAPSAPESPVLFISQRGTGNVTVMAYAQLLLLLIASLMVISSVTLAVYGFYLNKTIADKKELLAGTEKTFIELPSDQMKKTYDRFGLLTQLLKDYVSIRSPLKLLESVVEDKAYFDDFLLLKQAKGGYTASFLVITKDYQSLIQQLEALKLSEYSKIAPQPKVDRFKKDDEENLTVEVNTPVMVQGVLPDEVVFLTGKEDAPASVETQTSTQQTSSSSSTPQ